MARAPFSIFTRKGKNEKLVYCARFFDSEGAVVKTITIREAKSPSSAARIAANKLNNGDIANVKAPSAYEYIMQFWTRESEYAQRKERRKSPLSTSYLYGNRNLIRKYFEPVLRNRQLLDLTPGMIESHVAQLSRQGVSGRTINMGIQAIKVPLRWFCRMHRAHDPLEFVEREIEESKERGVLSTAEVQAIIATNGVIGAAPRPTSQLHGPGKADLAPNAYTAILLGALCGLRAGEVRGLQFDDVDEKLGVIYVRNNWQDSEKRLKGPKMGSYRTVPAPDLVIAAVRRCAEFATGSFVFYSNTRADKPAGSAVLKQGFLKALHAIGITDLDKQKRNLVFHGLRHFYVSITRAAGIPDYIVQRLAGHHSMKMTDAYSHVNNVLDFAAARASLEATVLMKSQKA
jgi:integrase